MKYFAILLFVGIIGSYLIYRKITNFLTKINSFYNENAKSNQDSSNKTKVGTSNEVIYKNGEVEVLVGEAKRRD